MKRLKDLKGNVYEFIKFEEKSIDHELKSGSHIDDNMHVKCKDSKGNVRYLRALDIEFIKENSK